jgi:hypothetical protein
MVGRDDRRCELDPAAWPFPADAWVILLFWLVAVTLTVAYWIFD